MTIVIVSLGNVGKVTADDLMRDHHADHKVLAVRLAEDYILPAYDRLVAETQAQAQAWGEFCVAQKKIDPQELLTHYHAVADIWAAIEHINFGPASQLNRRDRFYYWPERRNATGRGLTKLLAEPDTAALAPQRFAQASVAVQGLPALERLLFEGPQPNGPWPGASPESVRRCAIGRTIADNLASVARETLEAWLGPEGVLALLAGEGRHPVYFAEPTEALRQFMSDLLFGFQVMADIKLKPVIGADIKRARPLRAEAWRSGRSRRNLQLNVEGLLQMYEILSDSVSTKVDQDIRNSFATAQRAISELPEDFAAAAADPGRRPILATIVPTIHDTREQVGKKLPAELRVTVSFNFNDGD